MLISPDTFKPLFPWLHLLRLAHYLPELVPKFRAPFERVPLAYHVHFILYPKVPKPSTVDFRHALSVVGLAVEFSGDDPKATRRAAWQMMQRVETTKFTEKDGIIAKVWTGALTVMHDTLWHPDPAHFIREIINRIIETPDELSVPKTKSKRAPRGSKRSRKK